MEVVVVPMKDLHFDSTTSTPYVSAPASPRRFGGGEPFNYYCHYTSAPTSPTRVAALYAASVAPFDWEEASGGARKPQAGGGDNEDGDFNIQDDDFAFEFSGQLEKGVLPPELTAADELFEEGRIRPLKPPPRLYDLDVVSDKAPSPKSPKGGSWTPRQRSKRGGGGGGGDPFAATGRVEATTRRRERGREGGGAFPSPSPSPSIPSSRSRKGSRSLSPMRGSFMQSPVNSPSQASTSAAASSVKSRGSSKKWRLRDLLLFRSASEGRVTGNRSKDPLRKYTMLPSFNSSSSILPPSSANKRGGGGGGGEDSRNSSFRSSDGSVGSSTRRGSMSPHEVHYKSNRAASEEMKKKTPLPFVRQGIFGCLRYNPAVQSVARGFKNSSSFHHRRSQ